MEKQQKCCNGAGRLSSLCLFVLFLVLLLKNWVISEVWSSAAGASRSRPPRYQVLLLPAPLRPDTAGMTDFNGPPERHDRHELCARSDSLSDSLSCCPRRPGPTGESDSFGCRSSCVEWTPLGTGSERLVKEAVAGTEQSDSVQLTVLSSCAQTYQSV